MFRILLVNGFWIWLDSFSLSFKLALRAGPCSWLLWGNGTIGMITPTFRKAMRIDNRCAELLALQVSGGCPWEIPIISLGFCSVLLLSCLFPVPPLICSQFLPLFRCCIWHFHSRFGIPLGSWVPRLPSSQTQTWLFSRLWQLPWPFSVHFLPSWSVQQVPKSVPETLASVQVNSLLWAHSRIASFSFFV